ncbi:MAG: efflux RND transporter periplasmic adaptor subunit [Clostridia bacterium]|nr:efflux RND transporter periplasmic adaptor subunit [Clostridia bacterium]
MMKNKWLILSIIFISLTTGCQQRSDSEVNSDSNIISETPVITVHPIEMDFQESFLGIGYFKASNTLKINTGNSGSVEQILVSPGQSIHTGDILFKLDQSDYENNYKKVESQLRTVRDNAYILYQDQEKDFQQKSILYEKGALSKLELDNARSALSQSKKNYQDAITAYSTQTATSKDALEDRTITSPIDGRIGAIYIKVHEEVQNTVAMEIINDNPMYVYAMVTGKILTSISREDEVLIYPDGDETFALAGYVSNFNIIPDETNGLFQVEIIVKDAPHSTHTGEYAEVEFIRQRRKNLAILKKSIIQDNNQSYVYTVENSISRKTPVLTGSTEQQYIEIIDGLDIDDAVVIQGQSFLEDGDMVIEQSQ